MPTVEQVQDTVEKVLIENGKRARTAKELSSSTAPSAASDPRSQHPADAKSMEDIDLPVPPRDNDLKRENANIDGDTAMGTMLKYGSEGAKQFYEMFILKPEHAKAHRRGRHPHPRPGFPDPDHHLLPDRPASSCFDGGFCTGHGFLREPNDIQSYAALACIAIQSNQNDQHGGQSDPELRLRHGQGRDENLSRSATMAEPGASALELGWRGRRPERRADDAAEVGDE